jgi:hypothetical protein
MIGSAHSMAGVRGLVAAPVLLVGALVAFMVSNQLITIGPFNRAQIGWFVVVPLYLTSPGALSLAWRSPETRRWGIVLTAVLSAAIGVALAASIATMSTQIGCRPIAGPADALPVALAVGIVGALGYAVPVLVASIPARQGRWRRALVTGAGSAFIGIATTLAVAVALWGSGAGCAAPR